MEIFWTLFNKITPAYVYILLGFIAGKYLKADRLTIANVLFYFLSPLIFFNAVSRIELNVNVITVPLATFTLSTISCIVFYKIARLLYKDSSKNIIAFSSGNANTGFFGLPIALELFDEKTVQIYILGMLGVTLYENSFGYYIASKGKYTRKEITKRILKLPTLQAFFIALILNSFSAKIPVFLDDFFANMRGTYIVLGMMIIGIVLSSIENFKFDFKFISILFSAKFILWPLLAITLIYLDSHFINFYTDKIYNVFILTAIVPLASNSVIIATLFKMVPEKVASAVLLSTFVDLFYLPFMVELLMR